MWNTYKLHSNAEHLNNVHVESSENVALRRELSLVSSLSWSLGFVLSTPEDKPNVHGVLKRMPFDPTLPIRNYLG